MDALNSFASVLMAVFGLGFVIFLHELGHFAVAKWNGVKVEKFYLGIGPPLWNFTRGETEYGIAWLPIGGFVGMLGEGVEGGDVAKAKGTEPGEPESDSPRAIDPRSFQAKSVGARMAIMSAGVIMNLILGLACFSIAYGLGMSELPAIAGGVVAGSPAYVAGIRPGDEIVSIDGRSDLGFRDMNLKFSLSAAGQKLNLILKRPGIAAPIAIQVEPRREPPATMPMVGVASAPGLTLIRIPPFLAPAGMDGVPSSPGGGFKVGDKVVAAGLPGESLTPVADAFAFQHLLDRYVDRPLEVTVERGPVAESKTKTPGKRETIAVPPNHFVDFGFQATIGPVVAIRRGSPAEAAGFRAGDRIVKVDGRDDFDPMRLPTTLRGKAGTPVAFEVERNVDGQTRIVPITATPDDSPPWVHSEGVIRPNAPLDLPGLGLAYPVEPKVRSVAAGSPAARAGLEPEDVITAIAFLPPKVSPSATAPTARKSKPLLLKLDGAEESWPSAFDQIQRDPKAAVELTTRRTKAPIRIEPEADPTWPHPLRGLGFGSLVRELPPQGFVGSIRRGFRESSESVLQIYAMFRSLAQGRVSTKNLAGMPRIADIAYKSASAGLVPLLQFLGLISINLAVLNFLPIPPLDGGQMAYLVAEKIRGRPLPKSAQDAGTIAGFVLVLALIVFTFSQDILVLIGVTSS